MRLSIVALVLLSGCGTTPKEVMDSGERTIHSLKFPPERAAHCMARNIENHRSVFMPVVRPVDNAFEVIVRFNVEHTAFVSLVEPMPPGSRATVWYRGYLFQGEEAKAAMLSGC